MVEQKLDLLESNLNKKDGLLKRMKEVLDRQLQLLEHSGMLIEELDSCMEEQGILTEKLETLNEEFDALYKYLQTVDISSTVSNASKIARIQELILLVTANYDNLQEKEQSVRQQVEAFFQKERKSFGTGRRSSKAAMDYYRSMSGSNVIPPQFMDQKK